MRTYVTPRLTFAPGAMVESLAFKVCSSNLMIYDLAVMELPIGSFLHLIIWLVWMANKDGRILVAFDECKW